MVRLVRDSVGRCLGKGGLITISFTCCFVVVRRGAFILQVRANQQQVAARICRQGAWYTRTVMAREAGRPVRVAVVTQARPETGSIQPSQRRSCGLHPRRQTKARRKHSPHPMGTNAKSMADSLLASGTPTLRRFRVERLRQSAPKEKREQVFLQQRTRRAAWPEPRTSARAAPPSRRW